jgi:autotransporter translocation and assembly factor TamB
LQVSDIVADSVYIEGELDTNRFTFEGVFAKQGGKSTANGYVEYDLRDSSLITWFDVSARLANIGVWPLNMLLSNLLQVHKGEVNGNLKATGTLAAPDIKGNLLIREAEFYVPILNLSSQYADVDVLFGNKKVIVDRLDAKVGNGRVQANGDYALFEQNHPFRFNFLISNVRYNPERRLKALIDGKISLSGSDTDPLYVAGNLNVKEGLIGYGLGDEIRVTSPEVLPIKPAEPAPPTYIDIHISGDKNIWIRNNDMDVEVVADLDIKVRDDPMPQITGSLNVKRGNVYYLDQVFRLDEGTILFPPSQELNPELDIWASMRADKVSTSQDSTEAITIIFHIGGTLYEFIPEFFTDPPVWSQTDILTYLHLGTTPDQGFQNFDIASSIPLWKFVSRDASRALQNWFGVDVLTIEDIGLESSPTKFNVGKYFGDKWYVSYTAPLSQPPGDTSHIYQQFSVEYTLDEKNFLIPIDSMRDTLDFSVNQDIIFDRDENGAQSLRYRFKLRY